MYTSASIGKGSGIRQDRMSAAKPSARRHHSTGGKLRQRTHSISPRCYWHPRQTQRPQPALPGRAAHSDPHPGLEVLRPAGPVGESVWNQTGTTHRKLPAGTCSSSSTGWTRSNWARTSWSRRPGTAGSWSGRPAPRPDRLVRMKGALINPPRGFVTPPADLSTILRKHSLREAVRQCVM